ncbi:hypothetical protein [Herbidospora daliensis]|nr:hypothetical protein [Herbidospora daliensis]
MSGQEDDQSAALATTNQTGKPPFAIDPSEWPTEADAIVDRYLTT